MEVGWSLIDIISDFYDLWPSRLPFRLIDFLLRLYGQLSVLFLTFFPFLIADSLRTYIDENYREIRKYHQLQFWQDVCRNSAVLELIYDEKNFYPKPAEDTENFFADRFVTEYTAEDSAGRLEQLRTRVEQEVTDSDTELFAVGRAEGTKEPNGQRVLQVSKVYLIVYCIK